MCRSAAEGGRRCHGKSCGAASARQRQRLSRARQQVLAAEIIGDPDLLATARAKLAQVTGTVAPDVPTTSPASAPPALAYRPREQKIREAAAAAGTTGPTEQRIRAAVESLAPGGRDYAGLLDVREALGNVDQAEFARVIREMAHNNRNVFLVPEDNRKALTDADHATAVRLGGEDNHLILIEHPRRDVTMPSSDAAAGHPQDRMMRSYLAAREGARFGRETLDTAPSPRRSRDRESTTAADSTESPAPRRRPPAPAGSNGEEPRGSRDTAPPAHGGSVVFGFVNTDRADDAPTTYGFVNGVPPHRRGT